MLEIARPIGLSSPKARSSNRLTRALRIALGILAMMGMSAAHAAPLSLMLYGDSLMAGYGLPSDEGFASVLRTELRNQGYEVDIINSSVSGDTSTDALRRLDQSIAQRPDAVLVGHGGNDMLQGLPPERLKTNLAKIITAFQSQGVPVLLLGMLASPRLGETYAAEFNGVYPALAAEYDLPLYPFFLDVVALDVRLNQADRIHPNARGVRTIVERMAPVILDFLRSR